MAKYHITKKGEPGVCRATKTCPLGGESEHYATKEEAAKAFEETHSGNLIPKQKALSFPSGVNKFHEIRHADYNAQEREIRKKFALPNNNYGAVTEEGRQILKDMWANRRREEDRIMKVFSQNQGDITTEEMIASGQVREDSVVPRAVQTSSYPILAYNVANADRATKEAFYKLPTSFHPAFLANRTDKGYASAGFKELVKLASDLHASDPSWRPNARSVVPRRVAKYSYGDTIHKRVGEAKDMQNVSAETYSLLEDGAKLRVGKDNADRFWGTVNSDSVNKPKISDYFRALKNFK